LPSTVGTLPTISALPLAVVSLRALRAEGGGEAVVGPLLTELQTQQVDGGFSLDQAELLTDAVPLGRGRRLQGISAGAPYLHRVLSCNLKGACLIVLGFHLRNRPFVNQSPDFHFLFRFFTQSTEGAGEGIRPSTGERVQVRVTLRKVRFSDSPFDNSGLLGRS
jgi:hypothetical protein